MIAPSEELNHAYIREWSNTNKWNSRISWLSLFAMYALLTIWSPALLWGASEQTMIVTVLLFTVGAIFLSTVHEHHRNSLEQHQQIYWTLLQLLKKQGMPS